MTAKEAAKNSEAETIINYITNNSAIKKFKIHPNEFNVYDFSMVSAGTPTTYYTPKVYGMVEVKSRNCNSEQYIKQGAMLEVAKVSSMSLKMAETSQSPDNINKRMEMYYLCEFSDYTYLFNLSNMDMGKINYTYCPTVSTEGFDRYGESKYKPVFYLDFEQAQEVYPTIK